MLRPHYYGVQFACGRDLVRPAERNHHADIVPIGVRARRLAVERIVQGQRDKEVLPQLAFDGRIDLQPVTAPVAQAREVVDARVDGRLGPGIGVVGALEADEAFDVPRWVGVDAVLVVVVPELLPCRMSVTCGRLAGR